MKQILNLGDKYGDWEVINDIPEVRTGSQKYYQCKCKCGAIKWLHYSSLVSGKTLMCKECSRKARRKVPILNGKYKDFTVIDTNPVLTRTGALRYKAQCKCGTVRLMSISQLEDPTRYFCCVRCANQHRNLSVADKVGDITQSRYYDLQQAAKRRNYSFSVSKEYLWNLYLQQGGRCALTGDEISLKTKKDNASLDRIDSSIGYEEGNVQWVTKEANICKNRLNQIKFIELCQKIVNHANQQPSTPLTKCEGSETNS